MDKPRRRRLLYVVRCQEGSPSYVGRGGHHTSRTRAPRYQLQEAHRVARSHDEEWRRAVGAHQKAPVPTTLRIAVLECVAEELI